MLLECAQLVPQGRANPRCTRLGTGTRQADGLRIWLFQAIGRTSNLNCLSVCLSVSVRLSLPPSLSLSLTRPGMCVCAWFWVCTDQLLLVTSLWPRNGVDGLDNTQRTGNPAYVYMASPSATWWTNDIEAHISPTKSAGAPDVPTVLPDYFNAESNAYCSVGGSVSGNCSPVASYVH